MIDDDDDTEPSERERRIAHQWGAILLMLWLAFLACLIVHALPGCSRPPVTPEHRDVFARVEQAWRDTPYLPDPGDCLRGARVLFTDRADFRVRCRAGGASDVADECLGHYSRGMFGRRSGWLALIIEGSLTAERDIRHSALHALVACTMERPATDPFDGHHSDELVWESGGPASAEQRARPD